MAPPPKKTPAVPSFDRIWHFRSPERKTLRVLVVLLDNIPDDLKASTQTVAGELLSKASTLLDQHNLELDHSADPTPFFPWRPRAIDASATDSIEQDMDDIQNALAPIRRGGETMNRLAIVFTKFSGSDKQSMGGGFRGWAYTKPQSRTNRLVEGMVFINAETVPSATDRATLLHEMIHCAGCTHLPAASADAVAKGIPQDVMSVIGDLSGEGTPPNRTGVNIWQVQSLMKFAGVPWGFDPGWTASERGWR